MALMTLIKHPRTQVPRSPPQGNPRQFVAKKRQYSSVRQLNLAKKARFSLLTDGFFIIFAPKSCKL